MHAVPQPFRAREDTGDRPEASPVQSGGAAAMVAIAAVTPVALAGGSLGSHDKMIAQVAAVGVLVVAGETRELLPYAHVLLQELLGENMDIKHDLVELGDPDRELDCGACYLVDGNHAIRAAWFAGNGKEQRRSAKLALAVGLFTGADLGSRRRMLKRNPR
ncbi:unnamed protein product, partial [Prorocentrum cordatum]